MIWCALLAIPVFGSTLENLKFFSSAGEQTLEEQLVLHGLRTGDIGARRWELPLESPVQRVAAYRLNDADSEEAVFEEDECDYQAALLRLMRANPAARTNVLFDRMSKQGWNVAKFTIEDFREKTRRRSRLEFCEYTQLVYGYRKLGQAFRPDKVAIETACNRRTSHTSDDFRRWMEVVLFKNAEPILVKGRYVQMSDFQFKLLLGKLLEEVQWGSTFV